jgi:hypothetical protein
MAGCAGNRRYGKPEAWFKLSAWRWSEGYGRPREPREPAQSSWERTVCLVLDYRTRPSDLRQIGRQAPVLRSSRSAKNRSDFLFR